MVFVSVTPFQRDAKGTLLEASFGGSNRGDRRRSKWKLGLHRAMTNELWRQDDAASVGQVGLAGRESRIVRMSERNRALGVANTSCSGEFRDVSAETVAKRGTTRAPRARTATKSRSLSTATSQPWNKGLPHPPEVRARISASRRGIAPWNKGKALSEAHRQKISASHEGRSLSEEHRQRISKGMRRRPDDVLSTERGGVFPECAFDASTQEEFRRLQSLVLSADHDVSMMSEPSSFRTDHNGEQNAETLDAAELANDTAETRAQNNERADESVSSKRPNSETSCLDSVAIDVQRFTRLRAELRAWSQLFARFHAGRRPTLVDVRRMASPEVIEKFEMYLKLRERLRNFADEVLGDTLMIPGINRKGMQKSMDEPADKELLAKSVSATMPLTHSLTQDTTSDEDQSPAKMVSIGAPRVLKKTPASPVELMRRNARRPIALWPSQSQANAAVIEAPDSGANAGALKRGRSRTALMHSSDAESEEQRYASNGPKIPPFSGDHETIIDMRMNEGATKGGSQEHHGSGARDAPRRRAKGRSRSKDTNKLSSDPIAAHWSNNLGADDRGLHNSAVPEEIRAWSRSIRDDNGHASPKTDEIAASSTVRGADESTRINEVVKMKPSRSVGSAKRAYKKQSQLNSESKLSRTGDVEKANADQWTTTNLAADDEQTTDLSHSGLEAGTAKKNDEQAHLSCATSSQANAKTSRRANLKTTSRNRRPMDKSVSERNPEPPTLSARQVQSDAQMDSQQETAPGAAEESTTVPGDAMPAAQASRNQSESTNTVAAVSQPEASLNSFEAVGNEDDELLGPSASNLELGPADYRLIGRVRLLGTEELHEFISLRRSLRKWSEQFKSKYGRRPSVQDADAPLAPEDDASLRKRQCERYFELLDAMEVLMKELYEESFLELLEKQHARLEMLVERIAKHQAQRRKKSSHE
ncbi:hypothetical protein F1559_004545 [Cyanidiococcus yangmingshanensis]|uniref:Nuclease associated modular domain-containing protein n=1 Tax=Cyanidiococcus yangmingshanensis TaxID=2690220 RepID=A0A7J7IHK1_9RHOD|nr:hypothetical protein F1559_004545 [Cyanidiococcus yangmingshanensis]